MMRDNSKKYLQEVQAQMAKLRDLVNVEANVEHVVIQGVEIPIMFSMASIDYIQEAYGKPYPQFERDMNSMLQKKQITLGRNELKIVRSLIYGMVRAGGTECTIQELEGSIPISDIQAVYQAAMDVFINSNFQQNDLETVKKPQNKQNKANSQPSYRNRNKKNKKPHGTSTYTLPSHS